MRKHGFTLIELLAVIVILAIIALIATPIVINIIDGVKLSSIKRSSEGYIHALDITLGQVRLDNNNPTTCEVVDGKLLCNEKEYTVNTSRDTFLLTELVVSEEGYISAVIKKDNYCIMKRGEDSVYTYKKIVDKVNNLEEEITENNCSLDPHTSEKCFAFDSSTGTITKYYWWENNDKSNPACPKDVIIPKQIGGLEVTAIGQLAFYQQRLTSVIVPEGVVAIANSAFGGNFIESVSLPATITSLAYSAFTNNKLPQESAYFYKRNSDGSVDYSTIIGYGGANAEGGKNITIPSEKNGVKLTTIDKSAFKGSSLTSIVIPKGVTTINDHAFFQNQLTNVVIPEGVTTIAANAFANNYLASVTLPLTLTSLDSSAFTNNKLPQETAYFYKRNSDGSIDYSTIIAYGGSNAEGGKDITIPSEKNGVKLTTINKSAFKSAGLTSVVIPKGVTTINASAFYANQLTNVVIPEGVTTIKDNAFTNNLIKTLSLPKTLTLLDSSAFTNNKLPQESAYFYKRNSDGSIDYSTLKGYGGELKDITIPSEKNGVKLTTIDISAFKGSGLTSVVIPEGVKTINRTVFMSNKLTSIIIPESVTDIGKQAFYGNSLTSVKIQNSKGNVTLGNQAFGTFDIDNIVWNYVKETE